MRLSRPGATLQPGAVAIGAAAGQQGEDEMTRELARHHLREAGVATGWLGIDAESLVAAAEAEGVASILQSGELPSGLCDAYRSYLRTLAGRRRPAGAHDEPPAGDAEDGVYTAAAGEHPLSCRCAACVEGDPWADGAAWQGWN